MSVEVGVEAPKLPLQARVAEGVIIASNFLPKSAEPVSGNNELVLARYITAAFANHVDQYGTAPIDSGVTATATRLLSDVCSTYEQVESLTDDETVILGALDLFSFAIARARHIKTAAKLGVTPLRSSVHALYREARLVPPNLGNIQAEKIDDSNRPLYEQDALIWELFGIHPAQLAVTFRDGPKDDWEKQANCKGTDPDELFVTGTLQNNVVERLCRSCPVRPDCVVTAVSITEDEFGVRGSTERNRRRVRNIIGDDPLEWSKGALRREARRQRATRKIRDVMQAKQDGSVADGRAALTED